MAVKPDVRVVGNEIFIQGLPPITIKDKEKWQSMSLVERSDAVEEIYNSVKPRRVGRAALQGATFGLSDEAIAAASSPKAALAAAVSGEESEASAPYYEALGRERQMLDQYRQQFPIGSAVSEIGGAAIPAAAAAFATRGSSLPATASRMQKIAESAKQAAKIGAVEGAAYGFGTSEGGAAERLKGTAAGTALGATFGPVAQAATYPVAVGANFLISTAKNVFGPRGGKAVQAELQRLADATGLTVDETAERVANGEIMAENETLRMTVRSLMAKGGAGETMVRQTFSGDQAANIIGRPKLKRDEAMGEIEQYLALNASDAGKNPKAIQADFDAQVKRAEGEAYKNVPLFKSPADLGIANVMQSSVRQYPRVAEELNDFVTGTSKGTKLIGKKDGEFVLLRAPTLEEGEAARRYFRDKAQEMFRSGNPMGNRYAEVRTELEALINQQSDELQSVRRNASQVRTARDAYDYGLSILNKSSDDVDLYLRDILDDEQALRSLRAGALANIRQKIEQAGGTNLMNKLRDAETKEGKIFRAIYPPNKIEDTLQKVQQAATSQTAMGEIIKGPSTALVQEASKRTGADITAEDISNIFNPMTAMRVGMKIAESLKPDLNEKQRTQILSVLLSEDPDVVRRALTDTEGLQNLIGSIERLSGAARAGVRRGTVQQVTQETNRQGLLNMAR
jgi:hypothetical protein